MKEKVVLALAVAGLLLASSFPLDAQTTTGRIRGTVHDQDGAVIPGTTITISSPAMMGTRVAVTGETGAYRFTALPVGAYSVLAEMDGFQAQSIEGVTVGIGSTADANFTLYAEFVEAVTVSGESALVDVSSSSAGTTFTVDFIEDLPTARNFYDMMAVAPGVSLGAEDSSRVVAFGSNVQSNAWFTDGIEVTAPETGTSWVGVNPDMIQEIQVMGIGATAEFGNMSGAALNVVTKSGSNDLKGTFNIYYSDDSMQDSDINFTESEFSEYHMDFMDATATLGGPVKKDRLWYMLAAEYWRDNHAFPGTDFSINPEWYQDRYDLKLSARLSDQNLLDIKGGFTEWGYPSPANEFATQSAQAGEVGDDTIWGVNFQSVLSDRTFAEVRYSGWKSNDDNLSQTGSLEPAFIDWTPEGGGPPTYSGGVWWPWVYDTSIDQFNVTVSHFADDFLNGDHDFKFGVGISKGDAITQVAGSMTGDYYYHYLYEYDYYGTIYPYDYFVKVDGQPYFYGNEQESWSAFVNDSWAVSDRLTLNLGVRFDSHTGIIPDFPRLDSWDQPTGEIIPGINPVFEWDNISPRLGFAYNAGAKRETVIRGSFGVYYDGNVGGNWNSPPPFPPTLAAYASLSGPNGPFDIFWWDWDAGANNVDPNLEAPKTLQYSLGFERAFADKYSFGIQAVYKDTSNMIGWEFLDDGVFTTFEFTDPFNNRVYTVREYEVFPTTRKGNRPGDTAAGFLDDYWQEYKGVVLTLNRRFTDNWSMQASYTYSESTGLNPRALSQWQNNPLYGSKEGSNPNQWFNVDGEIQSGDRPHMFRLLTNIELPWNMVANASINLQSGRPYFRQIRAPYATNASRQDYFVAEQFRHPFQELIDVSIGKRFAVGDGEVKLDLQIFNILNDDATDWFEDVRLSPGDSFRPNWWVKPRRLMVRLGYES